MDTIAETIREWEMRLRAERKSARTVAIYLWHTRKLAAANVGRRAKEYKRGDLDRYLAECSLGWSSSTMRQAVAAFRVFFRYVRGDKKSPARALPFPRKGAPVRRVRTLTAAQASDALAVCESTNAAGLRELALLAVLLDTGLRAAEVCRLQVADVDFGARRLSVRAKGDKTRRGHFSSETGRYLAAWLGARATLARPGVAEVFIALGGTLRGRPLTPRGLSKLLARVGARAGVGKLAPHDLRRTFAHLALRAGSPTRVLQEAGGWEDLRQVETYSREIGLDDFDPYLAVGRLMA